MIPEEVGTDAHKPNKLSEREPEFSEERTVNQEDTAHTVQEYPEERPVQTDLYGNNMGLGCSKVAGNLSYLTQDTIKQEHNSPFAWVKEGEPPQDKPPQDNPLNAALGKERKAKRNAKTAKMTRLALKGVTCPLMNADSNHLRNKLILIPTLKIV
jgi:hypothetical protein